MKHLTQQELIDLPGYGRAEKHLRETGRWAGITETEDAMIEIDAALEKAVAAINSVKWRYKELQNTMKELK